MFHHKYKTYFTPQTKTQTHEEETKTLPEVDFTTNMKPSERRKYKYVFLQNKHICLLPARPPVVVELYGGAVGSGVHIDHYIVLLQLGPFRCTGGPEGAQTQPCAPGQASHASGGLGYDMIEQDLVLLC